MPERGHQRHVGEECAKQNGIVMTSILNSASHLSRDFSFARGGGSRLVPDCGDRATGAADCRPRFGRASRAPRTCHFLRPLKKSLSREEFARPRSSTLDARIFWASQPPRSWSSLRGLLARRGRVGRPPAAGPGGRRPPLRRRRHRTRRRAGLASAASERMRARSKLMRRCLPSCARRSFERRVRNLRLRAAAVNPCSIVGDAQGVSNSKRLN